MPQISDVLRSILSASVTRNPAVHLCIFQVYFHLPVSFAAHVRVHQQFLGIPRIRQIYEWIRQTRSSEIHYDQDRMV